MACDVSIVKILCCTLGVIYRNLFFGNELRKFDFDFHREIDFSLQVHYWKTLSLKGWREKPGVEFLSPISISLWVKCSENSRAKTSKYLIWLKITIKNMWISLQLVLYSQFQCLPWSRKVKTFCTEVIQSYCIVYLYKEITQVQSSLSPLRMNENWFSGADRKFY